MTNRSASSVQHGHAFIRVMTLRLIDEHPDVCEHIYRVVGSDGHSDEFLAVEGELREAIGQCMVSMWQTYSGLPTLPKARI